MQIYKTQSPIAAKSHWLLSFVVMILITLGLMFLLQGIGLLLVHPLFKIPLDEFMAVITAQSSNPNARMAFLFVQGLGGGGAFLLSALIIAKFIDKADMGGKQQLARFKFIGFLILLGVLFGGVLFNSLMIDWNAKVRLPAFLSDLEQMFRSQEDQLMALTKYLTDFDDLKEFFMGLLVIGIAAGVGEEFLFRGVLQPKLQTYTGNAHLGIWLAAFIFSAIHLQFYGLVPRMVLGAIFGYLYYYSGSLVYPILAHIFNNAFTVILVYLNKLGKIDFNIEETDQVSIPYALLGLVVLMVSLKLFKAQHQTYKWDG